MSDMVLKNQELNVEAAKNILNACNDYVTAMIVKRDQFEAEIVKITENWKGGGKSTDAQLYQTLQEAKAVYASMLKSISYSINMITGVKAACNRIYSGYTGSSEKLF